MRLITNLELSDALENTYFYFVPKSDLTNAKVPVSRFRNTNISTSVLLFLSAAANLKNAMMQIN